MPVARCPTCGRVSSGTSCFACGYKGEGIDPEEAITQPTPALLQGFVPPSPAPRSPATPTPPPPASTAAQPVAPGEEITQPTPALLRGFVPPSPAPRSPATPSPSPPGSTAAQPVARPAHSRETPTAQAASLRAPSQVAPRPENPFAKKNGAVPPAVPRDSSAAPPDKAPNPFARPSNAPVPPPPPANPFAKAPPDSSEPAKKPSAVAAPSAASSRGGAATNTQHDEHGVFTSNIPSPKASGRTSPSASVPTNRVEISPSYLDGLDTLDSMRPLQRSSELDTQIPSDASLVARLSSLAASLENEKRTSDAALIYEAVGRLLSVAH